MQRIVYISRSVEISSAHRLHVQNLSDEENANIYGKCNHVNGHGHNYRITLTLRGPTNRYGMMMNLTELKDIMEKVVVEQMDHKCIDMDIEYFKSVPSTAENIAIYIWDEVTKLLPGSQLYEVRIDETGKNAAFYRGEEN